mgnify:CR=1 FL=1
MLLFCLKDYEQALKSATPPEEGAAPAINYVRLGLTDDEMEDWEEFKKEWEETYGLYVNDNTRTKTITNEKNAIKKDFTVFSEPLLTRMSGSAKITEADRLALNLPERDRERTPRAPITTAPDVALTPLEGGFIRQRQRVDADQTKASIHPLADGWKRYMKIGSPAPKNHIECPLIDVGSKALITFDGGVENDGKKIYAFYQWINMSNPANNSPVSPMAIVTVSAGTVG